MKTAISIPDGLLERANRFAQRIGMSRSELLQAALLEYLARHAPDTVTATMNRAVETAGESAEAFVEAASHTVLELVEW
jgi:metal-responsive CopG/Arc/MetJ family transcriptional regulator